MGSSARLPMMPPALHPGRTTRTSGPSHRPRARFPIHAAWYPVASPPPGPPAAPAECNPAKSGGAFRPGWMDFQPPRSPPPSKPQNSRPPTATRTIPSTTTTATAPTAKRSCATTTTSPARTVVAGAIGAPSTMRNPPHSMRENKRRERPAIDRSTNDRPEVRLPEDQQRGTYVKLHKHVIEDLMVAPGEEAGLETRSTSVTKSGWLHAKDAPSPKDLAKEDLEEFKEELATAQELLYATDT